MSRSTSNCTTGKILHGWSTWSVDAAAIRGIKSSDGGTDFKLRFIENSELVKKSLMPRRLILASGTGLVKRCHEKSIALL
jgi:hypothetical protein